MTRTTYLSDLFVLTTTFITTIGLSRFSSLCLSKHVLEWQKLDKTTQKRLSVEMATIPARIVLGFLMFPIIISGFEPLHTWRAEDTELSLLSCAVLTGTYLVDLTVPRSALSTVHYCMPAVILVILRAYASTFTPADAILSRSTISFMFFGASLGGIATAGLTFSFRCRDIWMRSKSSNALRSGYQAYAAWLPVLALTLILGHYYSAAYMHWWLSAGRERFGLWIYVLISWGILDSMLEVRFLWWFYDYERRYRDKAVRISQEAGKQVPIKAWWLPRWRFAAIRTVFAIWGVAMMLLFLRPFV